MDCKLKLLAIEAPQDNQISLKAVVGDRMPKATVLTASSGPQGLELARAEDPDVILLDIVMPGMDGYEICRKLKADPCLQTIPVVFLTALKTDRESRIRALEAGAEGFLSKPFDEMELLAQIRAMAKIKVLSQLRRNEQSLGLLFNTGNDAVFVHRMDGVTPGTFTEVNEVACQRLGYTRTEFLRLSPQDIDAGELTEVIRQAVNKIAASGHAVFESVHVSKSGVRIPVEITSRAFESGGEGYVLSIARDITDRKRAELEREVTLELLRFANLSQTTRELVHSAITFFQKQSGCEAVGVRLRQGEDFPYYETHGFPDEFARLETHLCARDAAGELIRDSNGNPMLECMCGNVICGRFDPRLPFFTPGGTFWTNSTSQLLASTNEADRQARTRNRCNGEGYESVALFPLRVGDDRLGLLQLNDRRPGRFNPETIALWERLAGNLAVALSKLQTDEALRESEQRHRTILRTAMDGFWRVDLRGRLIEVNDAYCRMSGYSEAELLTMSIAEIEAAESPVDTSSHLQKVITLGEDRFESIHRRKDGSCFPVDVSVQYKPAENGQLVVFLRDIADRKEMEKRLRQNEARYRALVEHAPIAIFVNRSDQVTLANQECLHLFGAQAQKQLLGKSPLELFHPEDHARVRQRIHVLRDLGRPVAAAEEKIIRLDGTPVDVEVSAAPFEDEGINSIHVVLRDISERKRAEDRLRRQIALTAAINEILQASLHAKTETEVARIGLSEAQRLTGSTCGWIGELNPTGRLDTIAFSVRKGVSFEHAGELEAQVNDMKSRGIFGQVLEDGRSLIANEPGKHPSRVGLPKEHPELSSFLGIPVKQEGRTIGIIALGNKPSDYTPHDQEAIETLSIALVEAIQRKRAEVKTAAPNEELRRWHDLTLGREDRVLELKREINALLLNAGQPLRYPSAIEGTNPTAPA
ncbi:MAG TPA: PAS domain S-box protein [Verrucomicrobiota bacterium]|nr:PAS domain S-box protein [Verrucomicrobiota bacterium]